MPGCIRPDGWQATEKPVIYARLYKTGWLASNGKTYKKETIYWSLIFLYR